MATVSKTPGSALLKAAEAKGAGRPTKYKPEYCDIVESLGRKGKSPAQIASILNVDRASLYRWASEHEDFAQSLSVAKTHEQRWWEDHAQEHLAADRYQAQVWRASMAARFRADYAETRAGVDLTVDLGKIVELSMQRERGPRVDFDAPLELPGAQAEKVEAAVVELKSAK